MCRRTKKRRQLSLLKKLMAMGGLEPPTTGPGFVDVRTPTLSN